MLKILKQFKKKIHSSHFSSILQEKSSINKKVRTSIFMVWSNEKFVFFSHNYLIGKLRTDINYND